MKGIEGEMVGMRGLKRDLSKGEVRKELPRELGVLEGREARA